MLRKITCIDYDKFVKEFLPEAATTASKSKFSSSLKTATALKLASLRRHSSSRRTTRSATRAAAELLQPPSTNPFKGMSDSNSEKAMYRKITTALNGALLCPGYKFIATPHKGDSPDGSGQAVDCGMYPTSALDRLEVVRGGEYGRTDWSSIEIAIECKLNERGGDPFDEKIDNDEPNADDRRKVLGQILSYMELVFDYQHRTYQYMILFLGKFARIVRVDRSGIFATHKFLYRKEGAKLARFLWCYSRLSDADRGHDTTAVRLKPRSKEADRMRDRVENVAESDYVGQSFKKLLDEDWPWWKLQVPDEAHPERPRYYLVGKPHFRAPGVAGRATRGYIALPADEKDDNFVYLKDAWRVVSDQIDKEGVILETLRHHKVEFVPTLICHGDIAGQVTKTQAVWAELYPEKDCHLKHHQHYRLAVKEVGKSIEEFTNGAELVTALYCCVKAHQQAYAKGIIHRDISAGNILLYRRADGKWQGLLNDWELSKHLAHQNGEGRQPDRTGTWRFLSANALNDHKKVIVVQDELESFFHVLLYIAIRFLPHNCDPDRVPQFLDDYFDGYSPTTTGHLCGWAKLSAMRDGVIRISLYNDEEKSHPNAALRFHWPGKPAKHKHPMNQLFKTFLSWFHAYYTLPQTPIDEDVEASDDEDEDDAAVPSASGILAEMGPEKELEAAEELSSTGSASSSPVPSPSSTILDLPGHHTAAQKPGPSPKKSRRELEQLAKNLSSHGPMLNELYTALSQKWPKEDRCEDRKPEKAWVPAKDPVVKGTKRSSEVLAERIGKPAKRSRVR
ncbi:hypothetical protein BV20DRAFT_1115799 [Pilatotrama ljubarskyi]|nr:hypothetical protein BV20DRAFT_1115799 [Pilatotrama ljubarskyi]